MSIVIMMTSCGENTDENSDIVYPVKGHPAYDNQVVLPYTQAIAQDVNNPEFFVQRAAALININCDTLAIIDLKRAVALDSTDVEYQVILGEVLNDNNLPHQAVVYFENVIQKEPQIPAYLGLLKSYILMKKYEAAYELISMLHTQIPKHPDLHFLEYELLLDDKKDTTTVIREMRQFVSEFPLAVNVKMLLAEMEFYTGDAQVVKTYEELFLSDTTDVYPFERIGDFYRKKGDFQKSLSYYKKSVHKDLNYYYGFYKIGSLYQEYDSLDKAMNHYMLAKEVNPAFAEAYQSIAIVFRIQGELDSFEVYRKIALRLKPSLEF